jgi:hypothetical protein
MILKIPVFENILYKTIKETLYQQGKSMQQWAAVAAQSMVWSAKILNRQLIQNTFFVRQLSL